MTQSLFPTSKEKNNLSAKLFTDGGARGNPGPAAIGAILFDGKNHQIASVKKYIGETTNNQAEYQALLAGLRLALEHKVSSIHCYLDSELVVKQVQGIYRVKEPTLQSLVSQVKSYRSQFRSFSISHVARKYNAQADALVNEALDEL